MKILLRRITASVIVVLLLNQGTKLSAQSKPWAVPKEYTSLSNPTGNNPQAVKDGKTLYTTYCTPCHGDKGKGDGAAAASLTPKPADHSSPAMLNETDGNLYYKISEGRMPMPTYKNVLTDAQRWELVVYIRTLCKASKK
ncbi:MAG: cytochrome c class I [Bacteroidetes bacterium]|nr:MAG: cytochrome c class I [Bacteroidota bacterium]